MALPLQKDDYVPEESIDCDEIIDTPNELNHLAYTWTMAIAESIFFVYRKTSKPMLLGEVLPYYGHPMAMQVSSETDLSLVRSGLQ